MYWIFFQNLPLFLYNVAHVFYQEPVSYVVYTPEKQNSFNVTTFIPVHVKVEKKCPCLNQRGNDYSLVQLQGTTIICTLWSWPVILDAKQLEV